MFILNMKFLSLILWLGRLYTDTDDAHYTNDDDNYAQWANYDYIGSFGVVPNEPKTPLSNKTYKKPTFGLKTLVMRTDITMLCCTIHGSF